MTTNDQIILRELLAQRRDQLLQPISEADFFELFAAEQAFKDFDLTWEEIESGIVGDGGDGGIDGFYTFINGVLIREDTDLTVFRGEVAIEVHIIQAKKTSGFSETAIQRLRSSTEDLLDLSKDLESLRGVYNLSLTTAAQRFRDAYKKFAARLPRLAISYYFATLGDCVHPHVERQVTPLRQVISQLFSSAEFSFDFLGARQLLELTRKRPKTTYELRLSDSPISTERNSYVCLVRLDDYHKFMTDAQGNYIRSIFDANVRDHQGNVQVNRGIQDTLRNPQGEDFWWLNNGITILAERAPLSGKTFTLENPRVVNGLQTSLEIHHYFAVTGITEDTRRLLVRIIVPEASESYERIIRTTNSQTSIPIASLRAIDAVHRDIEDYFRGKGLYYDRRKNQYKNEGKPIDAIVSIGYVAQAMMSIVLGRPDDARARPSTLLKDDDEYQTVFNPNYSPDLYLLSTLVLRRVEMLLRSDRMDLSRKDTNNTRFHVAMFATWLRLNSTSPSVKEIAQLDINSLDDDFVVDAANEVLSIYDTLGADDQVAKGSGFVVEIKKRLGEMTFRGRVTGREVVMTQG